MYKISEKCNRVNANLLEDYMVVFYDTGTSSNVLSNAVAYYELNYYDNIYYSYIFKKLNDVEYKNVFFVELAICDNRIDHIVGMGKYTELSHVRTSANTVGIAYKDEKNFLKFKLKN